MPETIKSIIDPKKPQNIWLNAFWGFDPKEDGYIGWTREGDRKFIMNNAKEGDFFLIYGGSDSKETDLKDRRQVLGIIQISLRAIMYHEKCSDSSKKRREEKGWGDRWQYALPVLRAWRILPEARIDISYLIPKTCENNDPRLRAIRGVKIENEKDLERVHQLQIEETNVFGNLPIISPRSATDDESCPSSGFNPAFGTRVVNYLDGEHYLYIMKYDGPPERLLGSNENFHGKSVVKVGFSNDVKRRLEEINSGFPPKSKYRWKHCIDSAPYPDGKKAKEAEDRLKEHFSKNSRSLGGEFFLCDTKSLFRLFTDIAKAKCSLSI